MTSPSKDPARPDSELDYAPPWAREHMARDQGTRDQAARDPMASDPAPGEQIRPPPGQSGGMPTEQLTPNDLASENRSFIDDRPWHQRALEPELVPEPPAGASSLWPMMLRLALVCCIAAIVAGAAVMLFSPKQSAHKLGPDDASSQSAAADGPASPSIESPPVVPAMIAERLAAERLAAERLAAERLAAERSASANTPPPQMPQARLAGAAPAPTSEGQIANPTPPPQPPPRQIASLPAPNQSAPAEPASPVVNGPVPRSIEVPTTAPKPQPASNPGSPPGPAESPAQSAPKPAIVLDDSEIDTLIKRGKNLLSDGDFAAARVLFERAANAGSAEAALALGSTHDPLVIKRLGAIMVRPDIENARKWYQIAADRGSAAARLQLANLPQSR